MELQNAMITIRGLSENDEEPVELTTAGSFLPAEEGYLIRYAETELTGMEGAVSEILVRPDSVTLARDGEFRSRMTFERDRRHTGSYATPYGQMELTVATSRFENGIGAAGGSLSLHYTLSAASRLVSSNHLVISVRLTEKEKEQNTHVQ